MAEPRIGIALGSGGARGWAHIGVLRALTERGIQPQIVAGTSMGAVVGAAYAAEQLDALATWAGRLRWHDIRHFLDFGAGGGLIHGDRVVRLLREFFGERAMDALPREFGVVATDLERGRELWLREGDLSDALRASMAVPGLFAPVRMGDRWLVDGGLVNPVPVALCRAMGADYVIAVDLISDLLDANVRTAVTPQHRDHSWVGGLKRRLRSNRGNDPEVQTPGLLGVLQNGLYIMQTRISRSRMAGDPPDALVTPRLAGVGMLEFHRAAAGITEGEQAVARVGDTLDWLNMLVASHGG